MVIDNIYIYIYIYIAGMQMNGSENQVVLQIGRGEPKRISVQSLEPLKGLNDSSSD